MSNDPLQPGTLRFGDPDGFAIEAVAVERAGPLSFATLFLWIGGGRVGHADEVAVVNSLARTAERFLKDLPPQIPDELQGKDAEGLFAAVYDACFETVPDIPGCLVGLDHFYDAMILSPNGCECFDGVFVFVCPEAKWDRVVWRVTETGQIREVRLTAGEVAAAVRAFSAYPWEQSLG